MKLCTVYVTHSSFEEAQRIGRALLERRLVACVNILPPVRSIFWWEDRLQESEEVAWMAKARLKDFKEINKVIRKLHSYSTPCVVAWPIEKGDKEYCEWVELETRRKTQTKATSKSKDTGQ